MPGFDEANNRTGHTGWRGEKQGMGLPHGAPKLLWPFSRDGQCDRQLKHDRDEALGLDVATNRRDPQSFLPDVKPQHGTNEMKDGLPKATRSPGSALSATPDLWPTTRWHLAMGPNGQENDGRLGKP